MKVIQRKEAKAAGLTHYFTDKPCKHGHIAKRFAQDGQCAACKSARTAANGTYFHQYYLDNRTAKIAAAQKWAEENPERNLARIAAWSKANPGRKRAAARRWRRKHPTTFAERISDWGKRNPLRLKDYYHRRRARLLAGTAEEVLPEDLLDLREFQNDQCAYCDRQLEQGGHLDHKTPLVRGGSHCITNLHWTCARCNQSKGKRTHDEFLVYCMECEYVDKQPIRKRKRKISADANPF